MGVFWCELGVTARNSAALEPAVDTEKKAPVSWTWKRLPVDGREIEPAGDVAVQVNRWEDEVSKQVDQPVAVSLRHFERSEIKRLIEQAMRDQSGADFAFINQGGVRDILPRGQLLVRHIWNIMPFDNRVVFGKFKGRDLPPVVLGDQKSRPGTGVHSRCERFHCGQSERRRTTSVERPQILGRWWVAPRCARRLVPQKEGYRLRLGYPWPRYISHPRPNSATKKQTNTYTP